MATPAMEICTEPGVSDLPVACRLYFARALENERAGNTAEAEAYLDKALAAEAKHRGIKV